MGNYYSEENHGPHEYLDLGDFELASGITLPNARLAYKTRGTLNAAKDNAVLFPHMWSGTSASMEIFVGEGRPLDPSRYFVIFPGQFANGFSSRSSSMACMTSIRTSSRSDRSRPQSSSTISRPVDRWK